MTLTTSRRLGTYEIGRDKRGTNFCLHGETSYELRVRGDRAVDDRKAWDLLVESKPSPSAAGNEVIGDEVGSPATARCLSNG